MIVTTIEEQRRIGEAARRAGGYHKLARLLADKRRQSASTPCQPTLDLAPYQIIKAADELIPVNRVRRITLLDREGEEVMVRTDDGDFIARGQDALSIVLCLKPSSLEGRRRRWRKGSWAYHNLVGHPVMQIMAWCGFGKAAVRFHDRTVPSPIEAV